MPERRNRPENSLTIALADETVNIGDSLTSDIQGGINAGIRTIWFNPDDLQAADIHPDYEVKTLMEIPALLEEL